MAKCSCLAINKILLTSRTAAPTLSLNYMKPKVDLKLRNKRALVTGSSGGIGEALAKCLAQKGVRVIVHGWRDVAAQRVVDEISKAGGIAALTTGDIARDSSADHVAAETIQSFDGIDILVNNAGT